MSLKKNKYFRRIVNQQLGIILITILILSSCKTTRTVSKGINTSKNPVAQVIEQVQSTQPKFNTANVSKMSLELTLGERRVNVSATCRIKKDSVIYFSILPFMGIELYRAELTPVSLRLFDKTNRNYYETDYKFLSKYLGVDIDFHSLQSLLFNQFFCVGGKNIYPDSCTLTQLPPNLKKIDYHSSSIEQSTEISATNAIRQVVLKDKNSPVQLTTDYSDFTSVSGVNFPQKITMNASGEKSRASFEFTISKVEFNTDVKFQPTNTEHYTLSNINQLIKK
ncbi:MAG: DUF4292 domain-containing protein [Paludibacter sp.]